MLGRLEGGMSTPHSHPVILVCLLSECLTNCRRATARLYEVFRATEIYKYVYVSRRLLFCGQRYLSVNFMQFLPSCM